MCNKCKNKCKKMHVDIKQIAKSVRKKYMCMHTIIR